MNKNRILCIDLDDTLSLTAETILKYAIKFDKENLHGNGILKTIDTCEDYYYFARMLGWDRGDLIKFFDQCYIQYLKDIKVKPESSLIIKKIKQLGVKIYIITSRREQKNNVVEKITKNWLEKNGILYDKLYLDIVDKGELLQDINPTYFVDDSFKNCMDIFNKCKNTQVFLIETKFNQKIVVGKFNRIKTLDELYIQIKGDVSYEQFRNRQS